MIGNREGCRLREPLLDDPSSLLPQDTGPPPLMQFIPPPDVGCYMCNQ